MTDEQQPEAPGWEAIDAALAPRYADQKPLHWGTIISRRFGGKDPLDGISAYRRQDPVPHWHFVTYGFSELYAKESEDATSSGWGFELTFRLRRDAADDQPPAWAANLLQNLARYVFSSGRVFSAGDYLDLNGPIALGEDTAIRAILFAPDPELATIETPHGKLQFLQVVGITLDELLAAKSWNTLSLAHAMQDALPLLVTDLGRASLLSTSLREVVDRGVASEGSNTGHVFVDRLDWSRQPRLLRKAELRVVIGAKIVPDLLAVMPGRVRHDRAFALVGKDCRVEFVRSDSNDRGSAEGRALQLALRASTVDALCGSLQPIKGFYAINDLADARLVFEVVKTEIRDADGNVVETIG